MANKLNILRDGKESMTLPYIKLSLHNIYHYQSKPSLHFNIFVKHLSDNKAREISES